MLDRQTAPSFKALERVDIPRIKTSTLSNGRRVYHLLNTTTSVFKIELLIKAGSWYALDYHVVPITLKMLNEGTSKKSSKELSEAFDRLGSFTEFVPGFDNSSIGLYGLTKYFYQNLHLLSELIHKPAFNPNEFVSLKTREAQRLRLNLEKSSYKASSAFRNNIFGNYHPYGVIPNADSIENLTLSSVKDFYDTNFKEFDILLSGNIPTDFLTSLDKHFGTGLANQSNDSLRKKDSYHSPKEKLEERNEKFVQSSIRIGKKMFNRSHSDYRDFMVLNEVLGGYFGSRLMKNIREDKGYTYGIYSQLYALNYEGYLTIGTDVDTENETSTVEEIHKELEALKTVLVSPDELTTVKNYMAGTFAGSLTSPFSVMDKFKAVHYQGLNMTFFDDYIQSINTVTPEKLLTLAKAYLFGDFSTVIVGK